MLNLLSDQAPLRVFIFEGERERETEREQWEGEREREGAGEEQRERETQNLKQAPGSELSAQSLMRGWISQTTRS